MVVQYLTKYLVLLWRCHSCYAVAFLCFGLEGEDYVIDVLHNRYRGMILLTDREGTLNVVLHIAADLRSLVSLPVLCATDL